MDRTLKERIIGATVLVLFVVLVVPVFLDGPSNSGEVISEQVPLPGQSGEENQTIILNRDRTQPVPAAEPQEQQERPVSSTTAALAPQRAVEPEREPEPDPQPAQKAPEVVVAAVVEPASKVALLSRRSVSFFTSGPPCRILPNVRCE